jgi:glycosyltransferase involved in cell wall biosynthesis
VRIAMIGTRGVPALYGGFETAVEEIGTRLVERGHDVTVYCRNRDQTLGEYRGMKLVNLPSIRRRSLETLSHSGLSVLHARRRRLDAVVLFNAANAPFIPLLKARRIPTVIHMDGLEWKRAKWAGLGAQYYRRAEARAARSGLALIADAQGIADHLKAAYGRSSYVIPYGAPILDPGSDLLEQLGLEPGGYHLVVARMEPENHVLEIVAGFAAASSDAPLVVVGSSPYSGDYAARVHQAAGDADARFVGAVWDQDLLNQLYANAISYLHGHSVGGTNPSLLRALGCGAPVTAFDVTFNHEVTDGHARFFSTPAGVRAAVRADNADPTAAQLRGKLGREHAAATYRWDDVAARYERMLLEISGLVSARRRSEPTGLSHRSSSAHRSSPSS